MSTSRFAATLLASLAAFPLQAEDTLALDRFAVSVGGYATDLSAEATVKRAEGETADGSRRYGASSDHGLEFLELSWRPFERHSFRGAWFDHGRGTSRTLSADVDYGDVVYPVGATLDGELAVKVLELDYTYWMWLSRRNALGPVVGIVRIGVDTALSGTVVVDDIGQIDLASKAGDALIAPKIGLSYAHAFNERLRLTADVATFEHSVRAGDARIWDTSLGIEYYPWDHLGFALRHARTRIDADIASNGYDGSAELGFSGWQFLVRARW